jgi:hypothetical protein
MYNVIRVKMKYNEILLAYYYYYKTITKCNISHKRVRLIRSLKKFIFRYQDLVEIYSISAETIINDAFSYSDKDKEVNKNVKNIFLSMCDVKLFLTSTSLNLVLL